MTNQASAEVSLRKFDSDDILRLRSKDIVVIKKDVRGVPVDGDVDIGRLMRTSIILGVKRCEWFSSVIDENVGVTQDIFDQRSIEFRRIPIVAIDPLFKKIEAFNGMANAVDVVAMTKKSSPGSQGTSGGPGDIGAHNGSDDVQELELDSAAVTTDAVAGEEKI